MGYNACMVIRYLLLFIWIFSGCEKPPPDRASLREMDRIGTSISKTYELRHLYATIGNLVDSEQCAFALSLTSDKKMTLDEAKPFVKKLARDYLAETTKNKTISQYLIGDQHDVIHPAFFGFRLAFWDENVDRPLYPYLAQVRFADETIYFYYADPSTQALGQPVVFALSDL